MSIEELIQNCRNIGIDLDGETVGKLETYMNLLIEWNEKINLTAIKEPEEIIEKHFYDCILPLSSGLINGRCADVGSGAGFPDAAYAKAGAQICGDAKQLWDQCDFLAKVKEIEKSEYDNLRENQMIYCCIHPAGHPERSP